MATAQTQTGFPGSGSLENKTGGDRANAINGRHRFRYGYICRLIDDGELQNLPAALRASTRAAHKAAYWKSVSLLRRDAESVLRIRRERMAAEKQWDFQILVNDYARVQMLLAKLTVAGMGHSVRLGAGMESARNSLREFEMLLTSPSFHAAAA
jgi:hypothetical protein